mmetsp:Transcript_20067/g.43778  ORF Transcript_20067/g.43778 Transcript_20067/m.43778 type:complete len:580 (+) Transcript_20067:26-1765(+)
MCMVPQSGSAPACVDSDSDSCVEIVEQPSSADQTSCGPVAVPLTFENAEQEPAEQEPAAQVQFLVTDSSEDSLVELDGLYVVSFRDGRKKSKSKRKRKKKKKKQRKTKKRKAGNEGGVDMADEVRRVAQWLEAGAKPPSMSLPPVKLTPKQRLRQRILKKALRDAEEASSALREEKARQAAEWRDARDSESIMWGLHPQRPKCKARPRQLLLRLPEERCTSAGQAAGVPDEKSREEEAEKTTPFKNFELFEVPRPRGIASLARIAADVRPDEDGAQTPSSRPLQARGSEAGSLEARADSVAEERSADEKSAVADASAVPSRAAFMPLDIAGSELSFLSYESFDAKRSHDLAHGKRRREDEHESENNSGSQNEDGDDEEDDDDDDEETIEARKSSWRDEDWGPPPSELLPKDQVGDAPGDFVVHFVRYILAVWESHLNNGLRIEGRGLTEEAMTTFNSVVAFRKTVAALRPLLLQLRHRRISTEMLERLDAIVAYAAERDYPACIQEYMTITIGRKTWHQAVPQVMQQQNHGGAISKIIKQSPFLAFDKDLVVNAYALALKRIIQLAQWIHPSAELSKCI